MDLVNMWPTMDFPAADGTVGPQQGQQQGQQQQQTSSGAASTANVFMGASTPQPQGGM